ncbi:MAG TPA: UPF0280 family protein [Burkholderiaceae bacterium]|nr:UPF0280 family protein [Burkholderiaceae bacterium]
MSSGPLRARLSDGRWHFQHGPIDLVIEAGGDPAACDDALQAAWRRFQPLLAELVSELPELRRDGREHPVVRGPVARRMVDACVPLAERFDLFLTPMAAVAGAVAEELAQAFERPGIRRASLNNGGDIAVVLAPGESWRVGVVSDPGAPALDASFELDAGGRTRGVATSGWRGRSLSLGIADSATVLARSASRADAAATLIANAVDAGDPRIVRAPADSLRDGSDLGARLATVAVPPLPAVTVASALDAGATFAQRCIAGGFIDAALLWLQRRHRAVGAVGAKKAIATDGTIGPVRAVGPVGAPISAMPAA